MTFEIFPAIDLRHGRVVRLQLGDPDRQTVFGEDPVESGRRWLDAGANWLHVVNLDGAFSEGGRENWMALEKLAKLETRVQFGGGLRAVPDIGRALDCGVSRVVLGTAALANPAIVAEAITRFGEQRVIIGIDARNGRVRTHGWQTATTTSPTELAQAMRDMGIRTIIYTDISRDGILSGVNADATAEIAQATDLRVIASGGVNSLDDVASLVALAPVGVAGVIIGRALYEGQVDLAAAILVAAGGGIHAG